MVQFASNQYRSYHSATGLSVLTSQAIAESFTLDQTPATFLVNLNQTPLSLDHTPVTFPVNSDQTPLTLDQTSATFPAMLHQTLFT